MKKLKKYIKIDFSRVETWLFFFFVFFLVFCLVIVKILGASELPKKFVEKNGYCKLKYGEGSYYDDKTFTCGSEPFLVEDFEKVCPDHKIFSKGFNSICFKMGSNLFDNEKIRNQYENETNIE